MSGFSNLLTSFLAGLSKKEKRLFYASAALLLLLSFDRIAYSPLSERIRILREEIESQKNLIRKNILIIEHKEKIVAEREAYDDFFTEAGLSHEEKVAQFLSEIEGLAKASNVTLVDIGSVQVVERPGYSLFLLDIDCRGRMPDFLQFVHTVEGSAKPLRVVSYEITPQRREEYTVGGSLNLEKLIIAAKEIEREYLD